ncbi:hypothetical protein [Streptomyces sp. NPDC050504]|uniref:hypothetical protein n=1 Tax=Streptomyces sp. NPDC050504 TaxID=3365618 RepID=UPI0037A6E342
MPDSPLRTPPDPPAAGRGATGPGTPDPPAAAPFLSRTRVRLAVALSGWVALAATALPAGSAVRGLPVLLFVCFGPGFAVLYPQPGMLRPTARLEALAFTAPVSLSLSALAATSLFLVESFSATAFLVSTAAFTTVVAFCPGLPLPAATRGAVERRPRRKAAGVKRR